ncbi:COX15/CtaA family protein [Aquimarina sp. MMG016]|uniref:COX15/CtaA family protein n=1 Tax=Aquimarina sp. MMG016 TaxID=2822690 RepID=UPI001B3A520F|nr:COX15/CtaA family protein [Aquimarina sp. MMG016]MBQ4820252.1 COX15/CtaA family protein [Aquimarina sp. MMG016]
MKKYFRPLVITSLVFIYLIIIAGAVVRMTGSGMGCPDWPKCFGYYIPPTEEAQIQWQPNVEYKKGFIVIVNEELRIAPKDFVSTETYNPTNWKGYTKHDYAKFNVWHTWIEYINRLVTVLSGIPMLIMFLISFTYWKTRKQIPVFTTITILAMGFQAWLGKVVVDSNLLPFRITIHMVMAFVILAILLYILFLTRKKETSRTFTNTFKGVFIFSVILTLVQVALGTQVRQHVDEQVKAIGELAKSEWLNPPTITFYIHRSFSVLVVLVNAWLFLQHKKLQLGLSKLNWVLIFIGLEALSGIIMYYFDFPFLTQPLHLVLASLLFGVQFFILLEVFKLKKPNSKI